MEEPSAQGRGESERKPRPFQFHLSTLCLLVVTAATLMYLAHIESQFHLQKIKAQIGEERWRIEAEKINYLVRGNVSVLRFWLSPFFLAFVAYGNEWRMRRRDRIERDHNSRGTGCLITGFGLMSLAIVIAGLQVSRIKLENADHMDAVELWTRFYCISQFNLLVNYAFGALVLSSVIGALTSFFANTEISKGNLS